MTNEDTLRPTATKIRKEAKILVRFPKEFLPDVKRMMAKHNVKTFQELFDSLVVNGVVFRNKDILDFIDANKKKYQDAFRANLLERFKGSKPDKKNRDDILYAVTAHLYSQDLFGLKSFLVDKSDLKLNWLYNILLIDGFTKEEPCIIAQIKKCQELEINKRKKNIARLSNDEYIEILPDYEAQDLLSMLTEEYEENKFGEDIQEGVNKFLGQKTSTSPETEDEDIDRELAEKITSIRRSRSSQITQEVIKNFKNAIQDSSDSENE